eukprot:CAMPEP_0182569508 /NCGR_PEP_ID=MMETSP1324-20130603/10119_1 /TAXON_ID=236786 /ORGANISM="Florenciella sp., Strain RCC1587" /LENGTH=241 /DNA_ID=CAMNT_0024783789 /DNA_START=158 /DNA_END=880 /DNA_ORIENTATION=+
MATQLLTFLYTPNGNDKKYLPIAKPIKVHGSEGVYYDGLISFEGDTPVSGVPAEDPMALLPPLDAAEAASLNLPHMKPVNLETFLMTYCNRLRMAKLEAGHDEVDAFGKRPLWVRHLVAKCRDMSFHHIEGNNLGNNTVLIGIKNLVKDNETISESYESPHLGFSRPGAQAKKGVVRYKRLVVRILLARLYTPRPRVVSNQSTNAHGASFRRILSSPKAGAGQGGASENGFNPSPLSNKLR